jgi:uracil DNA glycosylase
MPFTESIALSLSTLRAKIGVSTILLRHDTHSRRISFSSRKASGLAFDCSLYGDVSPSLTKLYDAIENDCYNGLYLNNKDNKSLQYLVDQGVMLANKALTCCKGEPVSHIALWEPFWKMVFENKTS